MPNGVVQVDCWYKMIKKHVILFFKTSPFSPLFLFNLKLLGEVSRCAFEGVECLFKQSVSFDEAVAGTPFNDI